MGALPITGGSLTGDVTVKKDIPKIQLETSNGLKKFEAFYNANNSTDYGIVFQKDDVDFLRIINDKDVRFKDTSGVWNSLANLKQSVSDGKVNVRNAITDKGGTVTDGDGDGIPTFDELVSGVNAITTAKKEASGATTSSGTNKTVSVRGLGFTPKVIHVHCYYTHYYARYYVGEGVSNEKSSRVRISTDSSGNVQDLQSLNAFNILVDGFDCDMGIGTSTTTFNWYASE
ncbi:hypothetical protein ABFJ98_3773 [Acinetobacter baumannii]